MVSASSMQALEQMKGELERLRARVAALEGQGDVVGAPHYR